MNQSQIDRLKKLSELYKAGILSKEEVEEQKKKLLNKESMASSKKKISSPIIIQMILIQMTL